MDRGEANGLEDDEGPRLCQACHEALAVVRVIEVRDGEEIEAWLCGRCARTDVF